MVGMGPTWTNSLLIVSMDSLKTLYPDDLSTNKDLDLSELPSPSTSTSTNNTNKLKILHVEDIPLECNYASLATSFDTFGQIKEIKMDLNENTQKWEAWLIYNTHEAAFKACKNIDTILICSNKVKGALTDKITKNLYSYKPSKWNSCNPPENPGLVRTQKPPMWLVATAKDDSYNYYKFSKHIQKLVGDIKSGDISRFGKGKVLIHAGSKNQSQMLCHMNLTNDPIIKDIKPHISFSYGRGVIFDKDLYEFEEPEILDMSPSNVWNVKKIPRTSMIVLSFEDPNIPSHVIFENERVRVRPFTPKPLQCYNCFRYGHSSNICKNSKICHNCTGQEHGHCQVAPYCVNCNESHKSTDKKCEAYKYEERVLWKANTEHITIGYAKRLVGRPQSYANALKNPRPITTGVPATTAPTTGGAAVDQVVTTLVSESDTPPGGVGASQSKLALLPSEKKIPSRQNIPPTPNQSPIIQEISQADSLPDLMEQEQGPKRGRSPSHSPPHVRPKRNSPQRISEVQIANAEIHHPSNQKRKDKDKSKNKPLIARKPNKSNK